MTGKSTSRIPWRVNLEKLQESRLVPVPPKWRKRFGTGTMTMVA